MKDESGIVHEISIEGSIENVFDAIAQAQQRMAWWGQGRFPVTGWSLISAQEASGRCGSRIPTARKGSRGKLFVNRDEVWLHLQNLMPARPAGEWK